MPESPSPFQAEEGFPVLAGMIHQRVSGSATFAAEATYGYVYSTPAATGNNCWLYFFQFKVPNYIVPSSIFYKIVLRGANYKEKEDIVEDQHLCVVVHKYIYLKKCVLYYYGASWVFNPLTVCREIRQTLDAKMRQLF